MDVRQLIQSTKWHKLRDAQGDAGPVSELLLDLLDADSRDEAVECVEALTDRVGHQGSAVTEATAPVTQVLSSMIADPAFRWKADVLCTLDIFSRSIGAWERVSFFGRRGKTEKQAEAALVAVLPAARGLLNDEDPEVRAMSADLIASATPNADAVVAELMTLFTAEPNLATRATIAEAVARNVARMTNPAATAKATGWCDELLRSAEPAVRFRVARGRLAGKSGEQDPEAHRILQENSEIGSRSLWPAEL